LDGSSQQGLEKIRSGDHDTGGSNFDNVGLKGRAESAVSLDGTTNRSVDVVRNGEISRRGGKDLRQISILLTFDGFGGGGENRGEGSRKEEITSCFDLSSDEFSGVLYLFVERSHEAHEGLESAD
jgi:hypothetical protein